MTQKERLADVLIVGAGSSGCALAARMSEDPNRTVCLIEAGPDYPDLSQLPADLVNGHDNSYVAHDWRFSYLPIAGRQQPLPRGRVIGGSSSVNTTIALRGMPEDYDEWADAGNPGWGWREVLPAFCRLERDLDFGSAEYHGDAGPITIRRYPTNEMLPQHEAFLQTANELDYPYCADANDPLGWGAGPHPLNKLGQLRISTAIGYLAAVRARPNFSVLANTEVRRLLVEGGRCVGVEAKNAAGEFVHLTADLTVLCAGAIMSPTLLLRSGVGPREQLAARGIDVVQDVPGVGKNLSDHPAISVVCDVKDGVRIDHGGPLMQTILRYTAKNSDKRNDLQIEQLSFVGRKGEQRFAIAAVLEYQYGRGELRLADDPLDPPVIESQFVNDERDLSRLVTCFQDTLRFAETGSLGDMIEAVRFPDPARGGDRESLAQLCQRFAASGYHPCGTLKMGPATDPTSVVDARGRCHYVDQLVVADASIMPSVPRANTNLTSIMIGEKIGEWMRTETASFGL